MNNVCIITDSTAQFTQVPNANRNVVVVPMMSEINGLILDADEIKPMSSLPQRASISMRPQLVSPSAEKIYEIMAAKAHSNDAILGIFMSSHLNQIYTRAEEAASALRGGKKIQIIDSQTTSLGLGFLVEAASEAAAQGKSLEEIEQLVRNLSNHIYGIISVAGPSYLYSNNFIDLGQAIVSEILGLYPIFAIEEGRLSPIEKVRNYRNSIILFQEFIDEFDHLSRISYLQSSPAGNNEVHILRDHAREYFPKTPFSSHAINLSLATLLGPRSIGLFVVEEN
jgi:DegV family protein with EDD domain